MDNCNAIEDLKPPAKKSRLNRKRGNAAGGNEDSNIDKDGSGTTTLLSFDALFVVMEFLHPRDLLNTAFTCKTLRDMITTKLVVQSAMIHGGHAKKSMEEMYALMSNHSIHVPSPLRLLRISNGKICEFCLQAKVNHIRPGIGVFACWDCVTNGEYDLSVCPPRRVSFSLTTPYKREGRAKIIVIFQHDRVAASQYGRNYYAWSRPQSDRAGERVGPIVASRDVNVMAIHFGRDTVDEMIDGGIDKYLENELNAPPIDRYSEFNDTYADMQQRAEAARQEREQNKRNKKERTKDNKIAKVEKMLDKLTPLIDEGFREVAMRRFESRWFREPSAKLSSTPCVCMETPFIDGILQLYTITPSKMKKKIQIELAETINGKLRFIAEKNLFAMEFLSDGDPFEAALKRYFGEVLPNFEALFQKDRSNNKYQNKCETNRIDGTFMTLLKSDRLLGALCHIMYEELDLGPALLTVEPSASAARLAVNYSDTTTKQLASTIWTKCLKEEEINRDDDARFSRAFEVSQERFGQALILMDEYLAWLIDKVEQEDKRQDLVEQVERVARYYPYLNMLMKREFRHMEMIQQNEMW